MTVVFTRYHKVSAIRRPVETYWLAFALLFEQRFCISCRCTVLITTPSIILYTICGYLVLHNGGVFFIFDGFLIVLVIHALDVVMFCKIHTCRIGVENSPFRF